MSPLSSEHEIAHKYLIKNNDWYKHCWWKGWYDLCEQMREKYLTEQKGKEHG